MNNHAIIYHADVFDALSYIQNDSIQCVVCSPPYFNKRQYNVFGQIGLEPTPEDYVQSLQFVFREIKRVLKPDGTLWLNLGDSYISAKGRSSFNTQTISNNKYRGENIQDRVDLRGHARWKDKDLAMIPARVSIALHDDGWYIRNEIIWYKKTALPESVKDRFSCVTERIYLLTKNKKYYFDQDAGREPYKNSTFPRMARGVSSKHKWVEGYENNMKQWNKPRLNKKVERKFNGESNKDYGGNGSKIQGHTGYYDAKGRLMYNPKGRNGKDVWEMSPGQCSGSHFAVFSEELPRRAILCGTKKDDMVLDPFCGSGTTGKVALELGRDFVGIELNGNYVDNLILSRLNNTMPLFNNVEVIRLESGEYEDDCKKKNGINCQLPFL